MNKKAIYTCITGNYDDLQEPKYMMEGWDYIVFSNDLKLPDNSVWKLRSIKYNNKNNLILSRFPKINPHLVLNDYHVSIFIDSNICILDNKLEQRVNELIHSNIAISIAKHPERNCIYEEAKICLQEGLDKKNTVADHISILKSEGFPENFGLFENNIIYRKHNEPQIIDLNESWWNLFLRSSRRDQLSLSFLLWKKDITCEPLFEDGFNVRHSSSFTYSFHKKSNIPILKRIKKKLSKILNWRI